MDSDNDGTLDMAEVETAGATIFATLDKDKEGTLDAGELAGRLSADELQDLDSNRSGTLDRNEYAKADSETPTPAATAPSTRAR
jgi:hypothetical protein